MFGIKKTALCLVLCLLTSCGFRPVYYTGKGEVPFDAKTATIQIMPIPDEIGRICKQELKNNLNPENKNEPYKYRLNVSLDKQEIRDQGILEDNTATRATMIMKAHYSLTEIATRKEVAKGTVFAESSYNILRANPYATITKADSTEKELVKNLANQIALHLTEKIRDK
ncbi:MAG: hypothetical protein IJC30_01730 [Alphaproteobacteria bacterium]|nr:hypothetical protein [Alphaproteobacteria bacterium]